MNLISPEVVYTFTVTYNVGVQFRTQRSCMRLYGSSLNNLLSQIAGTEVSEKSLKFQIN